MGISRSIRGNHERAQLANKLLVLIFLSSSGSETAKVDPDCASREDRECGEGEGQAWWAAEQGHF